MSGWGKGAGIGGVTGATEREDITETMHKSLLQQRIQVPRTRSLEQLWLITWSNKIKTKL